MDSIRCAKIKIVYYYKIHKNTIIILVYTCECYQHDRCNGKNMRGIKRDQSFSFFF